MANFIAMVYATLKENGIDTSGMSTDEAVKKFNELKGSNEGDKKELTANESKRLKELGVTDEASVKLTQGQKDFFRDTKATDENGQPIKLYHGTKTKGFEEFRYNPNNQTGQNFGEAYYFTTSYKNAKGYAKDNTKDPRINKYYEEKNNLIQKLLKETDATEKEKIKNQIKNVKVDDKNLEQLLSDTDYDTGGEVKEVYLNTKNPLVVNANGKYFYEVYEEYFKNAKTNQNDGIIIKNVKDNSSANTGESSDVYVVFKPNQIKSTTNKNPTNSNNINK